MHADSEATRRALLTAAAKLFDERGYTGTSITAVSRACGLTSGAVYFHFAGKHRLARAVIEELFASWPLLIAQVAELDAPMLDRIVRLSFIVARAYRDDLIVRAGSRLWVERKAVDAALPAPFLGWMDTLAGMLAAGRADGSVAGRVEPQPCAEFLVSAFFGVHTVSDVLDGRRLVERRVAGMWRQVLPGLVPPGADPAALLDWAQGRDQARDRQPEEGGAGGGARRDAVYAR